MKLELKHLSPYLPFGLKCQVKDQGLVGIAQLNGICSDGNCVFHDIVESQKGFSEIKPILRPLNDLSMDFWENNITDPVQILELKDIYFIKNNSRGHFNLYQLLYLFNHHFDVFGLIEKGLAIDINTLNP